MNHLLQRVRLKELNFRYNQLEILLEIPWKTQNYALGDTEMNQQFYKMGSRAFSKYLNISKLMATLD